MAVSVLHCCYAISDLSITVRNLQPRPLSYNTITAIDQRALVHASLASCYFESAAGYATSTEEEYGAPSLVPPISASAATVHLAQQRTQPQPAPPVLKKRKRYRKMYPGEDKGITEEMRFVAMKLRNSNSPLISNEKKVGIEVERNLSGSESDSESSGIWLPSIEGCMKYLVDSKLVFQTLERIVEESNDVSYAYFRKTGLERSAALTNDLEFLSQQEAEVPEPSSPGLTYAAYLEELAQKSAPLFLSHFYNVYLAHLSGGQVIAKQVSDKLLDGRDLEFYKWESDPELLLKDVRDKLNKLGENWSRDDKNKCLKEMAIVSRELDEMSVKLFEGLLEHGRLTLTQILDRARAGSNEGFNEDLYRESFTKLVRSRYVEHCPAPEPLVQLNPDEENPSKKRRSRSSKIAQKEVTTEVRALIAATPMEAERFSLVTDAGIDIDEEKGRDESIGGKRKRGIDDELEFSGCLKEPIWRVNFEEFIRCLRNKVCIEATRAQLDDKAGIVLSAMLESSKCKEHKVSLSLDGIFEEVMKNETGRMMTLEHVKTVLAQLGCHSTAEELYTLDLKNIIKLAQNEEVESIVLKRYGRDAYKMFRLLAKSGQAFDTDKISDTVFVDKKDTTKTLSMLWKDNYLHMEKVNVAGPRLTEIIYWRVNKGTLQEQVLDELYHAGLNLILRGTYEREKEREVTCLVQEQLVGEARKRYSRLIKVGRLLYSATMKLDDAIMLFHDF